MNYHSVVNFTVFTTKLWELVTGNWTIIYSKKIMEAVKPRFGQADKKQQQLTSRTWGLHSAGQLRSKGQAGSWSWGRTPWSSPRPVRTGGRPSPSQGQCALLLGTDTPSTDSKHRGLSWAGRAVACPSASDRATGMGLEGSTFRQPEADSARLPLLEAGRRGQGWTGGLRNGADTTAGSRVGTAALPQEKASRPLTTGHVRHSTWRQSRAWHEVSHMVAQPSRGAPWTYTISVSHASQQSRRTRWGDGPLQRGPGSEVLSDGEAWACARGRRTPRARAAPGCLAASSLPVSTLELFGVLLRALAPGTECSPGGGDPRLCLGS